MVRVWDGIRARVRVGLELGLGGRFRCQRIIDSLLPVGLRDPWGSGAGCRYRIHDQN